MINNRLESLSLDHRRRFYAEEIGVVADIDSAPLIDAFARVPREKFLGSPPWQIAGESSIGKNSFRTTDKVEDLYHNVLVALKPDLKLNNGQPTALATWIAALHLTPGNRVFHIGCGTGYYTAIMAELVSPNGQVLAAEIEPDLAAAASANLQSYSNVTVRAGDGAAIQPGPCDAILVNAGVTHPHLPWLQQLKDGGRIVLPLTMTMKPGTGLGVMAKIIRARDGFPAEIVSMVGIYTSGSVRDESIEPLLRKAIESRALLQLKSVRLEAHEQTDSCLVHSPFVCLSSAPVSS